MEKFLEPRKKDKFILAIKKCIENSFGEGQWDELAYLTGGKKIIYRHPRLLRSLGFRDPDYGSNILDVLEQLIDDNSNNLQVIEKIVKLQEWLKDYDSEFYQELYGQDKIHLEAVEYLSIRNSFELDQHIVRIRNAVHDDPELAIGTTKEMLESVMKTVVESFGVSADKKEISDLLKLVQKKLNLEPSEVSPSARGAQTIKRTLSNLGQIVTGINELRNLYGTGHGKVNPTGVSERHARLVVGAGTTLAVFIMETFEARKGRITEKH
jgi:hypothetical protein